MTKPIRTVRIALQNGEPLPVQCHCMLTVDPGRADPRSAVWFAIVDDPGRKVAPEAKLKRQLIHLASGRRIATWPIAKTDYKQLGIEAMARIRARKGRGDKVAQLLTELEAAYGVARVWAALYERDRETLNPTPERI